MHRGWLMVTAALFLLSPASFLLGQQAERPLPDENEFLEDTRENLARSDRVQYRYAYKERRTELHMNPFGRVGTGEVRLYQVTPGPDQSVYYRQLLEQDGKPVTDSEPERHERQVRSGRSPVDDAVATLRFAIDRREAAGGRNAIVVRFEPRPDADPETREGKMAKAFEGQVWVDERAREVMRVEATAIDDLSYGWGGVLGRLGEGTKATMTREQVADGVWLPTSLRLQGEGRAFLFIRKLTIDHIIEWFDYEIPNPKPQIPNPSEPD